MIELWLAIAWGQTPAVGGLPREASAEPVCLQPFREDIVRAMVSGSAEAISADDPLGHKQLYIQFLDAVPCLDGQLPKDAWAELLIAEAIVARATGLPHWTRALTTAMSILPGTDKIPPYLLDGFVATPPPPFRPTRIPDDATLFVDGVLVSAVPRLAGQGLHIAQLWRDDTWTSLLLEDEPIPAEWLIPKAKEVEIIEIVPEAYRPRGRGSAGMVVGLTLTSQLVEDPGTFLADGQQVSAIAGLASNGVQPIAKSGGVFWDVGLPVTFPQIRTDATTGGFDVDPTASTLPMAHAGAAAVLENLHFGVGGGVIRLQRIEGNQLIGSWFPQPHVTIGARGPRTDFEVAGGATNTAAHGTLRAGSVVGPTDKTLSWRVGFDGSVALAWFFEEPPGERQAAVLQLQTLFRLDLAWGRGP